MAKMYAQQSIRHLLCMEVTFFCSFFLFFFVQSFSLSLELLYRERIAQISFIFPFVINGISIWTLIFLFCVYRCCFLRTNFVQMHESNGMYYIVEKGKKNKRFSCYFFIWLFGIRSQNSKQFYVRLSIVYMCQISYGFFFILSRLKDAYHQYTHKNKVINYYLLLFFALVSFIYRWFQVIHERKIITKPETATNTHWLAGWVWQWSRP